MSTWWTAIQWLHLIAMAFFVGGQLFLAGVVVPSLRGPETRAGLKAIARRFGYTTLVAVGVLLATGAAMASHYQLWGDGTLHVKLALVGVVGAIILWHLRHPNNGPLHGLMFIGSLAIVWLGVSIAH